MYSKTTSFIKAFVFSYDTKNFLFGNSLDLWLKDNTFYCGKSETFPPLPSKEGQQKEGCGCLFVCFWSKIVFWVSSFSIAFSSIQMAVADTNKWMHSYGNSYRHSTFSWYSLSVYCVPGTYCYLLQPSNGRHLGAHQMSTHCVCRKDCAWITHIAWSIKRSRLAIGILSSVFGFALLFAVLGQVLAFLWAFAFSSVKSVMLTRIDDIYVPSSSNILRP